MWAGMEDEATWRAEGLSATVDDSPPTLLSPRHGSSTEAGSPVKEPYTSTFHTEFMVTLDWVSRLISRRMPQAGSQDRGREEGPGEAEA